MAQHNDTGKWGEEVAAGLLVGMGYAIVARDVKVGRVEIDIIASYAGRICFVEVKTRSSDFVDPLEAVDTRKRARMVRAADTWMQGARVELEYQFDIILITGTPDNYTVEHIPDAFFPAISAR